MTRGRILFLNGVTSSGKTSIAEALQERDDVFFHVVANDLKWLATSIYGRTTGSIWAKSSS